MATQYTNLLGFALPTTGELSGTWGQVVNDSITELVEDSIAGTATASVTSGDWTLSTTGSGAANEARCAILVPTGSPGVTRNIIAPSSSKAYIVENQSNSAVVIKGVATVGATVASGTSALVAWTGSDFQLISQALANATGTLPVSKGGTGATTLTGVVKGTGTSALTAGSVSLTTEVTGTLPAANGGTNNTFFEVSGPASATKVYTFPNENMSVGYRAIPISGSAKTSNYQLTGNDVGKFIEVGTGGSITVVDGVFSTGDAVLLINNTSGTITITCSITTAYVAGTDGDRASVTVASRGFANVFFLSGTVCVISGNVT